MQTAGIATKDEQGQYKTEAPVREMEHRPQNNTAIVGILVAILTFLLVQTAGIAYWAGQQSSKQDATTVQIGELKTQLTYFQAQIQLLTTKLAALEAKDEGKKGR